MQRDRSSVHKAIGEHRIANTALTGNCIVDSQSGGPSGSFTDVQPSAPADGINDVGSAGGMLTYTGLQQSFNDVSPACQPVDALR
jgi:hypothetical protein